MRKSIGKSVIASLITIALCFTALLGTTYAWFTDSAESVNNKIISGSLDVQLLMNTGSGYEDISDSELPIFGKGSIAQANNAQTLWEPGKTQVAYLAIKNDGSLALKYTVYLNVDNVSKDLYEAMEYTITPDAQYETVTSWNGDGNKVVPGDQPVSDAVSLAPGEIHYFALSIHMSESAGNDYKSGEVNFDLNVFATQDTVESDSFGSDYDDISKQKWDEDGVLKVLSIGNSYSDDALEDHFYQIAKQIGVKEIKVARLYVAGCTLATHLSNAQNDAPNYVYYTNVDGTWNKISNYTMKSAVESENWDYITFQQQSHASGLADTYDDLQPLIDIVKKWSPKATLLWHMTWSNNADGTYNKNTVKMFEQIASAVELKVMPNDDIAFVVPTGTAIENARTSYLGTNYKTLNRNALHLSYGIGRYIAALTFAHSVTGLPIDNVTYTPTGEYAISESDRIVAIESVKNAIADPYSVTQSKYVTVNE